MRTTGAEPLASPEKKMKCTEDDVLSAERVRLRGSHMPNDRRKRELGKMRRIISAGEHKRPVSIAKTRRK